MGYETRVDRYGELPCGCFEGEECAECAPWSVEEVRDALELDRAADREATEHLEVTR
jgi:hypothetical protein